MSRRGICAAAGAGSGAGRAGGQRPTGARRGSATTTGAAVCSYSIHMEDEERDDSRVAAAGGCGGLVEGRFYKLSPRAPPLPLPPLSLLLLEQRCHSLEPRLHPSPRPSFPSAPNSGAFDQTGDGPEPAPWSSAESSCPVPRPQSPLIVTGARRMSRLRLRSHGRGL